MIKLTEGHVFASPRLLQVRHFDAEGTMGNTCGSTYVREEVQELSQLNEANLASIREIIGGPVEMTDGTLQIVETATSKKLRAQGRVWAQHVLEGPISWIISAVYIAATVVAGGTPLTALVMGIKALLGVSTPTTALPTAGDFTAAGAALASAASVVDDNATLLEAAETLSRAAIALESYATTPPAVPEEPAMVWITVAYIVAVLDAGIYIFLPWWTTVVLRLWQGRPWLHRVAGRSVLVGDVPWVSQSVEAFTSKLFALAYKNASISVASGNPCDHLVHRHTHRVVRGGLLAVGRPDGRLNALTSSENTVCLSVNQASSIQNYGVTCESITIGHNPFQLPLTANGIAIPDMRPQFLCERELGIDHATKEMRVGAEESVPLPARPARSFLSNLIAWVCCRQRRAFSSLSSSVLRARNMDTSKHGQGMDDSYSSRDDASFNGTSMFAGLAFESNPVKSPSALMGAMEVANESSHTRSVASLFSPSHPRCLLRMLTSQGLFHTGKEGADGEPEERCSLALATVINNLNISKRVRESARKHAHKQGVQVTNFKRIEPIAEPFLGAWMGTSTEFRTLSTQQVFQRQRMLQELYESRIASMQRLVSFFVLFHQMGKSVQDFWPSVSFGLLGYDMSRTQSIMRIATTASPVSGMEVRLRVLQLQREQEFAHGARTLQKAFRFQRAINADDDALMEMMMKGQITQGRLAEVMVIKAQRAGVESVGGLGSAARALRHANGGTTPTTAEQRQLLTDALKGSSSFNKLGPHTLRAVVEFFQLQDCEVGRVVCEQGEQHCKELWVVANGEFEVFFKQKGPKPICTLRAGSLFGEIGLMYEVGRSATIKCSSAGAVWSLSRKVLKFFMSRKGAATPGPGLFSSMSLQWMLQGLTEEQRDVVASQMEAVDLDGGVELASEGNLAEVFYIIQAGGVILSRKSSAATDEAEAGMVGMETVHLQSPTCFGEHCLNYSPEVASTTAVACTSPAPPTDVAGARWQSAVTAAMSGSASPAGGSNSPTKAVNGSSLKGRRPPMARRKPPPIWHETIVTDPAFAVTKLLWMSRDRFVELIGHLPETLRLNRIARILKDTVCFADLSARQKKEVGQQFQTVYFPPNTTIYSQDEPGDAFFVLLEGKIELWVADKLTNDLISAAAASSSDSQLPPVLLSLTVDAHGHVHASAASRERQRRVRASKEQRVRELDGSNFDAFGEGALQPGRAPPRTETARTITAVEALYLPRSVMENLSTSKKAIEHREQQRRRMERRRVRSLVLHRSDLEVVAQIGVTVFGKVKLVRRRGMDQVFALKSSSKMKVIHAKKVASVINEKRILDMIEHPFCCALASVFSDPDPHGSIHLLMDACLGGELYGLLRMASTFDLPTARHYGACVNLALAHLHEQNIVYRDLKPENIVIDASGWIQCAPALGSRGPTRNEPATTCFPNPTNRVSHISRIIYAAPFLCLLCSRCVG